MKIVPSQLLLICILLSAFCLSHVMADDASHSGYVPGQIIVKFKSDGPYAVPYCAGAVFQSRVPFESAASSRGEWLDALLAKFDVRDIQPLYRGLHFRQTSSAAQSLNALPSVQQLRDEEQKKTDIRKVRFAESRVKKEIPSKPSEMDEKDKFHIYILELDSGTDILYAVEEFRQLPHVEYARPNYILMVDDHEDR